MRMTALPARQLVLFGVLSLLDLLLTWRLLQDHDGLVYEGNVVARWFLDGYGWWGLAALKAGSVLVVVGLAAWVSRWRPRTGRWLLTFASSAVALVVLYSCLLTGFLEAGSAKGTALWEDRQEARWLEGQLRTALTYNDLRTAVGDFLISERCTFSEAVGLLLQGETSHSPTRLRILRSRYPGYSDEECLAANLLESVMLSLGKDHRARALQVARRLEADFRAYYGKPVPDPAGVLLALEGKQASPQGSDLAAPSEAPSGSGPGVWHSRRRPPPARANPGHPW